MKVHKYQDLRESIQTEMVINRLQLLVAGDIDMPSHAVTAALGLLRKVLPDLKQVEVSGDLGVAPVSAHGMWPLSA